MENYTYKDWLNGKIILKYDYFIPKGESPILVEWHNFSDEDILRIKRKQKKIFYERVANLLVKYKSVIIKEFEASKSPKCLYRETLNQIDIIFTGVLPETELMVTQFWDCVFFYDDLLEIREYYENNIINGKEADYAFINSPTMNYQRQGENSQIYAHALFLFRKWVDDEYGEAYNSHKDEKIIIQSIINKYKLSEEDLLKIVKDLSYNC